MTDFYSRSDMAYSGDRIFSIPFSYLDKAEVSVLVNDTAITDWTWLNESQISIDEDVVLVNGDIITVKRTTDIDEKIVEYTDRSMILNEENLNLSQDQLLFAVQEVYDNNIVFEDNFTTETNNKIQNFEDHINSQLTDVFEAAELIVTTIATVDQAVIDCTEKATEATEQVELAKAEVAKAQTAATEAQQTLVDVQAQADIINQATTEGLAAIEQDKAEALVEIGDSLDDSLNALSTQVNADKAELAEITSTMQYKFSMFDTVVKDHILSFEESKGFALQGTYVYKEAVAGSRYGYPDFYNECVTQKNAGTATQVTLGSNTITMYINDNGHQFYDIADKVAIDAWFNVYGEAWFYGVDTENERIFLPRTSKQQSRYLIEKKEPTSSDPTGYNLYNDGYLEQWGYTGNLGDGSVVTMPKAFDDTNYNLIAVLRNSTATSLDNWFSASKTGVQSFTVSCYKAAGNWEWTAKGYINSLVTGSEQYEKLYIVVGNTEVTSSVTDVVDITTSENDTTPLFTGLYFDFAPNHPSWLKAGMQQNSGGIYTTCYNELVNILNGQNPYNLKVVDVANLVSGTDYSEYWQVDQDNMSFRTPLTISDKSLSGAVMGNGYALGVTNGTQTGYAYRASSVNAVNFQTADVMPIPVGTQSNGTNFNTTTVGITTDPTTSGIIAQESTAQLYFKVANAVENLELLDVGRVLEAVSDVSAQITEIRTVVETYSNGTSWYRVWSDGWCEQGGVGKIGSVVTFLKTMIDTNYYISCTGREITLEEGVQATNLTTTSFKPYTKYSGSNCSWEVKGYIAQGG